MTQKRVRIVGVGRTALGRLGRSVIDLAKEALNCAAGDAGMQLKDIDGLVAVPSLADPHFMQGHYIATEVGMIHKKFLVRTVDTGGAGPISAIATAWSLINNQWAETVAIVAADSVLSLPSKEFLQRADKSIEGAKNLPSPCVPNGYDRIARWHLDEKNGFHGLRRDHFAMISVLMSWQASRHPAALTPFPHTLESVLASPKVGPVTNLLECARRADGGAAIVISSARHYKRNFPTHRYDRSPVLIATGEASGPLYPPPELSQIDPELFPDRRAFSMAYEQAQIGPKDIDFWGLYDCFPICFIRALVASRVVSASNVAEFIEDKYNKLRQGKLVVQDFPFNTHGGLQAFGAPWEVPAMYNIIEAVEQLRGEAHGRQLLDPRRALVYGNGGVLSSASVAILGKGTYL